VSKLAEEKNLKKEGEELAKIAVENGLGSKQLALLYRLAKIKPLPYVEAFVEKQMGRRVRGYIPFGRHVLELLEKYGERKASLQRIIMYANMLYDYYESLPHIGVQDAIEPIIKGITERYGYDGIELSPRRDYTELRVRLTDFRGNPKILASQIMEKIGENVPEASKLNLRVWIEQLEWR